MRISLFCAVLMMIASATYGLSKQAVVYKNCDVSSRSLLLLNCKANTGEAIVFSCCSDLPYWKDTWVRGYGANPPTICNDFASANNAFSCTQNSSIFGISSKVSPYLVKNLSGAKKVTCECSSK